MKWRKRIFSVKNRFQAVRLFLLCLLRSSLCCTIKLDIKEVERKGKACFVVPRSAVRPFPPFVLSGFPSDSFPIRTLTGRNDSTDVHLSLPYEKKYFKDFVNWFFVKNRQNVKKHNTFNWLSDSYSLQKFRQSFASFAKLLINYT